MGGLKDITIRDTIGMDDPWRYRNKAQFPVGVDKAVVIGFIKKYGVSIYDEKTGRGLIHHIVTRKGFRTGEVMVCIVTNLETLPNANVLAELLKDKIESLKSVILNVKLGDKNITLYGTDAIYD